MRTLVVGAGEMGRWIGDLLAQEPDTRLTFADTDDSTAEEAAAAVGGTTAAVDPSTGSSSDRFDLVILTVPIPVVEQTVRQQAVRVAKDGGMVDMAGVMRGPITAMEDALAPPQEADESGPEYASLHPLFAPPRSPGRIATVPGRVGTRIERLLALLRTAGNDVFETSAAEHDRAMETVQASAHAAILAYGIAADDIDPAFSTPVSERLEDLVATVTEGDPTTYADIQETFDGSDRVARAAMALADGDREEFVELFEQARALTGAQPRAARHDETDRDDTDPARSSDS